MQNRHNILLICTDQHRASITGCYENPVVHTANIDRLADEGMLFRNAYCNQPICVPSRMSFMTGRYPHEIETVHNNHVLDSRYPTLAHAACGAGYRTALAGRMHFVGPDQLHGYQQHVGSDYTAYAYHTGKINRYNPLPGMLGNCFLPDPLLTVGKGITSAQQLDIDTTQAAVEWLEEFEREENDSPFFLTVGYFAPHCPYIAPPRFYEKYEGLVHPYELSEGELERLHPHHRLHRSQIEIDSIPSENIRKATVAYYGLVDFIDEQIGKLLTQIDRLGELDNTIVVYMSDHGEMLGEHGHWHKGTFYEGASRVPLIIRHPDFGRSTAVDDPASLIDLYPTICDLVGREPVSGTHGRSLMRKLDPKHPVLGEWYDDQGSHRMVRRGRYKLNVYSGHDLPELFDLHEDPDETKNLGEDPAYSDVVQKLRPIIFEDGWSFDTAERIDSKLRRMGYFELTASMQGTEALIEDGTITDIQGYDPAVNRYENRLIE